MVLIGRTSLAERVVVVTSGVNIMELITRARTRLSVILVGEEYGEYAVVKKYFQQATDLDLVEVVQLNVSGDDKAHNEKSRWVCE